MLIQIYGAGFHNRGAQLMLFSTIKKLSELIPDAKFSVNMGQSTYLQRASYGLHTNFPKVPMRWSGRASSMLGYGSLISRMIPRRFSSQYGMARIHEIDGFVDISGYSFGDKWGTQNSLVASGYVKHMKKRGKPTIFLPQMFGPFENPPVLEAFRPAFEQATMICARDQISYDCLQGINSVNREVLLAPDITIGTEPILPSEPPEKDYACIIPNQRILDKSKEAWGEKYIPLLVKAIKQIESMDIQPRVLIHDGTKEDVMVGNKIIAAAGLGEEAIFSHEDPLVLKGFMSKARFVIGSRFHAIVSALSTYTPAIAIGWAHKYEMLMSDFGVQDFMLAPDYAEEQLPKMIDQLASPDFSQGISNTLKEKKSGMVAKLDDLWTRVSKELQS